MATFPETVPVPEPSINAVWAEVERRVRLPFVFRGPLHKRIPLIAKGWAFRVRAFTLFRVRLFIDGGAVNVPAGMVNAAPAVFPDVPNVRFVAGSVVIVPRVFTTGLSEF